MPKIRLIVEDDSGHETEHTYELSGDLDHLDGIDEAVEQFKTAALPRVEQHLLSQAQARAVAREKKTKKTATDA